MKRLLFVLLSLFALKLSGCVADPASPFIPAWKGVPALLMAPNSQEAYGWRKQRGHYSYETRLAPPGPPYYYDSESVEPSAVDYVEELDAPPAP